MSKVTIVGAGKTGRGFLARLLKEEEITFIDKDERLVAELNAKKRFEIEFFGNKKPTAEINFARACTWDQIGAIDADLILVSVGGSNLEAAGEALGKRLSGKKPRIIVCENASSPAVRLKKAMARSDAEVAEATVFCTTVEGEGLNIRSEWYPYLQFDAAPFTNVPDYAGLKAVENFGGFLDRKLYTYNSASCIIAYLGYQKGYINYADAANDEEILALLDRNYAVIDRCICREYGYDERDQKEFAMLSRAKFTDRTLVDTVARNAREPQRKITRRERVVAPLLLQAKYNEDTEVLEKTLAAMLLYTPETESEWRKILKEKGYRGVLDDLCELPHGEIYDRVLALAESGKII